MNLSFDDTPMAATPSPSTAHVAGRVNVVDKRVINGTTDVNQLVPFKHKWHGKSI